MTQPDPMATRRKAIESEVGHLTDAIAKGLLSSCLAKRLQHAEAALAALPAPPTVVRIDELLKRLAGGREALSPDGSQPRGCAHRRRARAGRVTGSTRPDMDCAAGWLSGRQGGLELQPLSASLFVVAGARFAHSLACHFATAGNDLPPRRDLQVSSGGRIWHIPPPCSIDCPASARLARSRRRRGLAAAGHRQLQVGEDQAGNAIHDPCDHGLLP
jgi:hypothetical protein